MNNFIPSSIPIYVFSLVIGVFGISQILNAGDMAANIPDSIPGRNLLIILSGVGLVLAAVAFIIDRFARLAGYLLALLLLMIVFTVDIPGAIHADQHAVQSLFITNTLKDLAIAMAAIIIGNLSKH